MLNDSVLHAATYTHLFKELIFKQFTMGGHLGDTNFIAARAMSVNYKALQ